MSLPVKPPIEPMLSKAASVIPEGEGWLYEPKWDGFRAIVFREDDDVHIGSRNSRPLERYFPELVETLKACLPNRCVVDGEIVIVGPSGLDFDSLQLRLHPAASRVNMLAGKIPSSFVAFDLLALDDDDLMAQPLTARRHALDGSMSRARHCLLTPQTDDPSVAMDWFTRFEGAGLDGLVAKHRDLAYRPGERVMVKVKHMRTADCVVGGYRLSKSKNAVGSLLLGLYSGGELHYAGHTSSFTMSHKRELLPKMRSLEGAGAFGQGRTPGGPSRWNQGRDQEWIEVRPELVCEVAFDHLQGPRFRHGTTFLRWREDKDPKDCTFDQLEPPRPLDIEEIRKMDR